MNKFIYALIPLFFYNFGSIRAGKVIYAVNAGGDSHIDSSNIKYL